MNEFYEIKRVWGDRAAFLGLFVLSLLIAYLITVSRSALLLSSPVELNYTGLSAAVPSGNGWHSDKRWKYHEDAFILSSIFAPEPGRPAAVVRCQYLFAAKETTPQTWFEEKASGVNGTIARSDRMQKGTLVIDWAQVKKEGTSMNLFFGMSELPNNRRLNIEVHQVRGDTGLADKVFERIADSLRFKDNGLLNAGGEIVAKVKSKGLAGFLYNQNQQVFFLIKTVGTRTEHVIGFTMDVLVDVGGNDKPNIQGAGLYYTRSPYGQEQVTSFRSDSRFDEFVWKSETYSPAGRSGSEITIDKGAAATVRKFDAQAEEKTYRLGSAAIPSIFLQQVLSEMLDGDRKEIVVDVIRSDGTITPAFISRIEPNDIADGEEAVYKLELGLLCDGGFAELVYLDKQKQISRKALHVEGALTFERVVLKDILAEFPERADTILRSDKTPEPNSL